MATRTKRPESRQRELMDAALDVFVRRGYAKTTVADITDAAGAAKGTFYLYFQSKEELITALRGEFLNDFLATVAERTGAVANQGWERQIDVFVDLFMESVLADPRLHDVFFHSGTRGGKQPTVDQSPVIQWLTNFIRAGVGAQVIEARNPEITAVLLFAASHQAVDLVMQSRADRDPIRAALVSLFHKTLGPSNGASPGDAPPTVGREAS